MAVVVKTVLGSRFGGCVNSPPILEPIFVGIVNFCMSHFRTLLFWVSCQFAGVCCHSFRTNSISYSHPANRWL